MSGSLSAPLRITIVLPFIQYHEVTHGIFHHATYLLPTGFENVVWNGKFGIAVDHQEEMRSVFFFPFSTFPLEVCFLHCK